MVSLALEKTRSDGAEVAGILRSQCAKSASRENLDSFHFPPTKWAVKVEPSSL
jgi:hypothetical protein